MPSEHSAKRGEVLVAIVNTTSDLEIARDQHWYRIPVSSVAKRLKDRWPPQWLAFYQTKVFGDEAYTVSYYARVAGIDQASRRELFPEHAKNEKSDRLYYRISLDALQRRSEPLVSRRLRRIVFIPTTWGKFVSANEINDLYDDSPLEDLLWEQLKLLVIRAERQEFVQVRERMYSLDFAVYCATGKLDVETDGDSWHANPQRALRDNRRDNDLESVGWNLLRFGSQQLREEMGRYCLPMIIKAVNNLGGVEEGAVVPRKIDPHALDGVMQLGLFDVRPHP